MGQIWISQGLHPGYWHLLEITKKKKKSFGALESFECANDKMAKRKDMPEISRISNGKVKDSSPL